METAGSLELLAAPRPVPLGPAATIPLSTTPVRDCQPVSTRPGDRLPSVAGPSPTPFVYVPGPTRKPRALLCVCCVKVTAELDLSPFPAPGDFPGKGLWGKLSKRKTWLAGDAGGSRRVWDRPRRRGKVREEDCNFPPSAGPCVTRSRGAFPPGSPNGADRLSCLSQGLPGLPSW